MIHLKNLTKYDPTFAYLKAHGWTPDFAANIIFLKAETGEDWYDTVPMFQKDTFKVAYGKDGYIHAIVKENNPDRGGFKCPSVLCPVNANVVELESIPEGAELGGGWIFDGEKVVPRPVDHLKVATKRRDAEMNATSARITALVEAKEDGDITPTEEAELPVLRAYRTALRRLDVSTAPDIEWPEPVTPL